MKQNRIKDTDEYVYISMMFSKYGKTILTYEKISKSAYEHFKMEKVLNNAVILISEDDLYKLKQCKNISVMEIKDYK